MDPDAFPGGKTPRTTPRSDAGEEPAAAGLQDALAVVVATQCEEEMADAGLRVACAET